MRLGPLLVIASALVLATASCTRAPEEAPTTAATAAPSGFSDAEQELIGTIDSFFDALVAALADADVVADDPMQLAAGLEAHMRPQLEPVVAARERYASIAHARRMELHQEVFRRDPELMHALMVETGRFAARFQVPGREHEFRPIARAVFEPWSEAGAFWVFEGFGPAAIREVTEWTTETEEQERARKAALAAAAQSKD